MGGEGGRVCVGVGVCVVGACMYYPCMRAWLGAFVGTRVRARAREPVGGAAWWVARVSE